MSSTEREALFSDARPRLLDLFCGAGGAAKGYQDAGFEVVGVDCSPQPQSRDLDLARAKGVALVEKSPHV